MGGVRAPMRARSASSEEKPELCRERALVLKSTLLAQPGLDDPADEVCLARRAAWAAVTDGRTAGPGIAAAADSLASLGSLLQSSCVSLKRLHTEFTCLDDGEAESMFGDHGALSQSASEAEEGALKCGDAAERVLQSSRTLASAAEGAGPAIDLPDPLSVGASLQSAVASVDDAAELAASLTSRRLAAVARAMAATEARAAAEAASAQGLLADVLRPGQHLDFPKVTNICERASKSDAELRSVARLISSTLRSHHSDASCRLKALTVAHELLYDPAACGALVDTPRLMESLEPSALCAPDQATGPAAECMQILAGEIRQRLEMTSALAAGSRCFSLVSLPCRAVQGKGVSSSGRGSALLRTKHDYCGSWATRRAAAEALARGIHARARSMSLQSLPSVLDGIFSMLDEISSLFARLHNDLDCLRDSVAAAEGVGQFQGDLGDLAALLLAAASVQQRALEWKAATIAAPDSYDAPIFEGGGRGLHMALVAFLEEAVAVCENLETYLSAYLQHRDLLLGLVQAAIEADAWSQGHALAAVECV